MLVVNGCFGGTMGERARRGGEWRAEEGRVCQRILPAETEEHRMRDVMAGRF